MPPANDRPGRVAHSSRLGDGREVAAYPGDAPLPDDVRRFFDAHAATNVELRHEWFSLLTQCIPGLASQARYLVLRDADGCAAVWPVLVGREAGALSNYFSALYAPAHRPGLVVADLVPLAHLLRRQAGHAPTYRFAPMDPQAQAFLLLEQTLRATGLLTSRYYRFGNWYLPTAGLDWDRYFADRPGELRNTVRRTRARFSQAGGTLELVSDRAALDRGIAAYEQVYAASWKEREPYQGFVSSLVRLCAEQGWLRLGIAWLDGRPIAAQIWIVAFGRAEIFKLAYDNDFRRFSPGTLLTTMLLKHCIEQDRVQEVDYLIGDDDYKSAWMTHRRERWGLVAHDPRTLRGALGALGQTLSAGFHAGMRALGLPDGRRLRPGEAQAHGRPAGLPQQHRTATPCARRKP
ncbi:MAG TPA: GNAT family N-acetyltransferase [Aquabacterium sp.]|nr:GNAT family N-acetyltransferase [Aquabacterium sp.]